MANIKAKASQLTPVITGEADLDYVRMSKLGAMFTADWKQQLIAAGLAWQAQVGGITAGADILPVLGGGNGTTMDTDQPEFVIGVGAGHYLIPMEAHISTSAHSVTDKTINTILLFADRTMSPVDTGAASSTAVTPVNLLDGAAGSFPGTALKSTTADVTDPVCTEILDFACNEGYVSATPGTAIQGLKMDYMPQAPSIIAGPCQVVLCWGSTNASGASGIGTVKVAVVPASYFPVV